MLSIGLMSGTSMDGIDAALLTTDGSPKLIKDLGHFSLDYSAEFKILLKAAAWSMRKHQGNIRTAEIFYAQDLQDYLSIILQIPDTQLIPHLVALNKYMHGCHPETSQITLQQVIQHSTHLHGLAVRGLLSKTGFDSQEIDVVGYHGQTLLHQPEQKISVIVGDGQYLADFLQINVVNDFRSRDIEAGGQGAPLAPLYHYALAIRDQKIPVAVINCGGIANITLISSPQELDLIAFDTGPGNGLIDRLVSQRTHGREHMDADGKYGRQGIVNQDILAALYAKSIIKNNENYFSTPPPKSLDIGDLALIPELDALSLEDACTTLEAFTADSMVNSLQLVTVNLPQRWILAGGGWNNPVILDELRKRLQKKLKTPPIIQTAHEAGWNTQAMEAQIFAYLAVCSLQNQPLSLPGTTRAPYPLTGGKTYFPAIIDVKK
jgi:anhydro-N-acetylmuramic acid kinase